MRVQDDLDAWEDEELRRRVAALEQQVAHVGEPECGDEAEGEWLAWRLHVLEERIKAIEEKLGIAGQRA